MALITIPTKDPDDELTNVEFNQLLEALKDGTRSVNTLSMQASTAVFTGAVNFLDDVTIGGQTGPFAEYWESSTAVYVRENGGVYDGVNYDGKSPAKALSSFQDAINNIDEIHGSTPSINNGIVIHCLDGGTYEEAISCKDYVNIYAPNAELKLGGTGSKQLTIRKNAVTFGKIYRESGANEMIMLSAQTSYYGKLVANLVSDKGTGTAIACTSPQIAYIDVNRIEILGGGVGISDDSTTEGHMHVWAQTILLGSNNAIGILKTRPGDCLGWIDGISYRDNIVTGTTGIQCSGGTISFALIDLTANTAYNISDTGRLELYANIINGTETVSGGGIADVVTPEIISGAISDIAGKEDYLGTPAVDGQVLASLTDDTRSWITAGNMTKATYDPTSVIGDAFDHTNHHGSHIDLGLGIADPDIQEGRLHWNDADNTLNIDTGLNGTRIQVGQESVRKIYNNTGNTLLNGRVVHYLPYETDGHPHAEYAQADSYETLEGSLSFVTGDILPGEFGFSTFFGKIRDFDTSGYSIGPIYLSDTIPGGFSNTKPAFPSYVIYLGAVTKVGDPGELVVSVQSHPQDTILNNWNCTIREELDFTVQSDGVDVIGYLEHDGGGDLTMLFSDGFSRLVCPPATIALVPGTNIAPVKNYIYIPKTTKVLTVSTSDWPTGEHIRVADVVLQTAANTQLYGAMANRNWNDHIQGTDNSGGHSHVGRWIRNRPASWDSGAAGTITIAGGGTDVYFSCTSGKVFQKHLQDFDAFNNGAGDVLFIANDPATNWRATANLNTISAVADGTLIGNNYFNIVVWGINNSTSEPDQIVVNLPGGVYNGPDDAILDVNRYDIYDIPRDYAGNGFLIGRYTIRLSGGIWSLHNSQDLRGQFASTVAGGGVGYGGVTEFTALSDTPSSYTGRAGNILLVNPTETGLDYVNGASDTFTTADGKTVTVINGYITSII